LVQKVYDDFSRFKESESEKESEKEGTGLVSGQRSSIPDDWTPPLPVETKTETKTKTATPPTTPFIPSATFSGPKSSYVYKNGPSGLGYYWDNPSGLTTPPSPPPLPPPLTDSIDAEAEVEFANLSQREIGNKFFVEGAYEQALVHYGAALAAGEKMDLDDVDGGDDDSVYTEGLQITEIVQADARAVLHTNRAACYLKLLQRLLSLPQGSLGVSVWSLPDGEEFTPEAGNLVGMCEAEGERGEARRFCGYYSN